MSKKLYIVFPYVSASAAFTIRGITFENSKNLESLPESDKAHLNILFSIFYSRNDRKIKEMVFSIINIEEEKDNIKKIYERIDEARLIINYINSTPDYYGSNYGSTLWSDEHSDCYLFFPTIVSFSELNGTIEIESKEELHKPIEGYRVWLNRQNEFAASEQSRIYPRVPNFWLHNHIDFYKNLEQIKQTKSWWAFCELINDLDVSKISQRAFTALDWYCKSNKASENEDSNLLGLAIGFESLFQIQQGEKLGDRFKETLFTFLGIDSKLESWVDQFYRARSEIVHRGKSTYPWFYSIDKKNFSDLIKREKIKDEIPYRYLTNYGRVIFRICLNAIISSEILSELCMLQGALVNNKNHLEEICKILKEDKTPQEKFRLIEKHIISLRSNLFDSRKHTEIKAIFATGKMILETFLDTEPDISKDIAELIDKIVKSSENISDDDLLADYSILAISLWNFLPKETIFDKLDQSLRSINSVHIYADFASAYQWLNELP